MTFIIDILLIFVEVFIILLILLINQQFRIYLKDLENTSDFKFEKLKDLTPLEVGYILHANREGYKQHRRLFETSVALLFSNDLIHIKDERFSCSSERKTVIEEMIYPSLIQDMFLSSPNYLPPLNKIYDKRKFSRYNEIIPNQLLKKRILFKSILLLRWYGLLFICTILILIFTNTFNLVALIGYGIIIVLFILAVKKTQIIKYPLTNSGKDIQNKLNRLLIDLKRDFLKSKDKSLEKWIFNIKSDLAYYLLIPHKRNKKYYKNENMIKTSIQNKTWIYNIIRSNINESLIDNKDAVETLNDLLNFLENLEYTYTYKPEKLGFHSSG